VDNADPTSIDVRPRKRRGGRRLFILFLATVAVTYVAVCVVIYAEQGRLIYFPPRECRVGPRHFGLDYEDLTLTTADGVAIAAWYVPCVGARATAIFCHGNAENLSDCLPTMKSLHLLRCNVLAFDYRGYGRSAGQPSENGTYADADAAWRYLAETRAVPPGQIVIVGRSLGGAVAIDLAARHTPGGLVVESTFTSLADVGQRAYPLLPVGLLCSYRYDSIKKVPTIPCPKLFFHGSGDELIPPENARRLFAAAAEPKDAIETPGGHNDGGFEYNHATMQQLDDWLDATIGARRT
jgi:uncharacterized protein